MRQNTRFIVRVAICVAMLIGGQMALSGISGIEIVTVMMLCFCFCYGIRCGVAIATVFSLLRCLVFGFQINVIVLYLVYYNLFAVFYGWLGTRFTGRISFAKQVIIIEGILIFADEELMIMDYNRVVKDLNGMSTGEFLQALQADFTVEDMGTEIYHPEALHVFALYIEGHWYKLVAKEGRYDDQDPIGVLDVTISSNLILDKLLGIKDLRSDKRIDFVGGIRGLQELSDRVDSGEMQMALALYPVTMKQLIDIADTGNIMPPKTTWFEPKLRSGLIIHELV